MTCFEAKICTNPGTLLGGVERWSGCMPAFPSRRESHLPAGSSRRSRSATQSAGRSSPPSQTLPSGSYSEQPQIAGLAANHTIQISSACVSNLAAEPYGIAGPGDVTKAFGEPLSGIAMQWHWVKPVQLNHKQQHWKGIPVNA